MAVDTTVIMKGVGVVTWLNRKSFLTMLLEYILPNDSQEQDRLSEYVLDLA